MKILKLLIVDNDPVSLQKLLKTYNWGDIGVEVIGTAQNMEEAISAIQQLKPQMVFMNFHKEMLAGFFLPVEAMDEEMLQEAMGKIYELYTDHVLPERQGENAETLLPNAEKKDMQEAVAYIENHLHQSELSIVDVAAHVYLNPVYFGRVFKRTFHMTFKQYLLQQRMERAKILLQNNNESIGSISVKVGINNPSYFSRLFKEYTGRLPNEYRKV